MSTQIATSGKIIVPFRSFTRNLDGSSALVIQPTANLNELYRAVGKPRTNDTFVQRTVAQTESLAVRSGMINSFLLSAASASLSEEQKAFVEFQYKLNFVGEEYTTPEGEVGRYGYDAHGNLRDNATDWVSLLPIRVILPKAIVEEITKAIAAESIREAISSAHKASANARISKVNTNRSLYETIEGEAGSSQDGEGNPTTTNQFNRGMQQQLEPDETPGDVSTAKPAAKGKQK